MKANQSKTEDPTPQSHWDRNTGTVAFLEEDRPEKQEEGNHSSLKVSSVFYYFSNCFYIHI